MATTYMTKSTDFTSELSHKLSTFTAENKVTIVGAAAIVGTCWGFPKIYFYLKRKTVKKLILEERERLKTAKEKLLDDLRTDKELLSKKDEILALSFNDLRSRLSDGKMSAPTVLRAYQLKALEENKDLNAIAHVIEDAQSLAEGYDADRKSTLLGGIPITLLGGIPITLKDHYNIRGRHSTMGLGTFLMKESEEDCVIVKALKKQGAIPYFVTTVPQLLLGANVRNPIHGDIYHPVDPARYPGGSSTGEGVLIARGGSVLGWGSDIGGSIREPAAINGIAGFRPTSTRVSHIGLPDAFGGQNLVQSSFGPMCREVEGLVQGMRALWNGYMFQLDPNVVPLKFDEEVYSSRKPLRIGYYTDLPGFCCSSPSSKRAVLRAKESLEKQGHQLVRFDIPQVEELTELYLKGFLSNDNLDERKILMQESSLDPTLEFIIDCDKYRIFTKLKSALQSLVSSLSGGIISLAKDSGSTAEFWEIVREAKRCRAEVNAAWNEAGLDALISPPSTVPTYYRDQLYVGMTYFNYLIIYNLLDLPVGVVPVTEVTQEDLQEQELLDDTVLGVNEIKATVDEKMVGQPVAVQVASLMFRDELCLRVMKDIEAALKKDQQ